MYVCKRYSLTRNPWGGTYRWMCREAFKQEHLALSFNGKDPWQRLTIRRSVYAYTLWHSTCTVEGGASWTACTIITSGRHHKWKNSDRLRQSPRSRKEACCCTVSNPWRDRASYLSHPHGLTTAHARMLAQEVYGWQKFPHPADAVTDHTVFLFIDSSIF